MYQEQEHDLRLGYGAVLLKSRKCLVLAPGVWCSEVLGSSREYQLEMG